MESRLGHASMMLFLWKGIRKNNIKQASQREILPITTSMNVGTVGIAFPCSGDPKCPAPPCKWLSIKKNNNNNTQGHITSYFRWLTKGSVIEHFSAIKKGPVT